MKRQGISIFFRLLIVFLGVVAIVSGMLTFVFSTFSINSIRNNTKQQIIQQFVNIEQNFHAIFEDALVKDIKILAANPLLDKFMMSSEFNKDINARAVERLFLQSVTLDKNYKSVYFVDVLGKERISVDREGRVREYRDLSGDIIFLKTKASGAGDVCIDGPYADDKGKISFLISIHKIDKDIGKFGGAVVIDYSLEEFLEFLGRARILDEDLICVFAHDGKLMKSPLSKYINFDPSTRFSSGFHEVMQVSVTNEGILAYKDFSVAPDVPLIKIAITVPSALLLKDIMPTMKFFTLAFMLSIIIALSIAFYISRYFSKPIVELASAATNLAKGDLSTRVNVKTSGEVQMLVDGFNKMAGDLQNTTTSIDNLNREIAERKKAEATVANYTRQLMDINKELDDFTYVVSHDLKEPLRSIDAFSKFLEKDYKDKFDKEGKNYINRVRINVQRMQQLIEDLLELSRIERSKNPFEEVSIESIIADLKLRLEYAIKEKNVKIKAEGVLPKVFCDRVRLTEVFANLVSNAIKFNDKPEPVIEIGSQLKGDFYEFYIRDNGPGIEEQYFGKIFQIFQRLGKREDHEGTGAGLTIVKKIIQMHKGKIWVASKVGEGTTFYFTIPKDKDIILGKKKIGEILVEKKLISKEEIERALKEQEKLG